MKRSTLLFLLVFFPAFFLGPERIVWALVHFTVALYRGQLPGQLLGLDELANIATVGGLLLALYIFARPPAVPGAQMPVTLRPGLKLLLFFGLLIAVWFLFKAPDPSCATPQAPFPAHQITVPVEHPRGDASTPCKEGRFRTAPPPG